MNRLYLLTLTIVALPILGSLSSMVNAQIRPLAPPSQHSMLDMTFPEFEAAVARTDVVLVPLGSVV